MDLKVKPSSKLILTSILSGSLTLIFSLLYTALSIIALIFRYECNAVSDESLTPSSFFTMTFYRVYILEEGCTLSASVDGVTSDYSVFVLTAITLSASLVTLLAAVILLSAITSASETQYLNIFIYGYLGVCFCSLIVDITFGSHFGMDFTYLTNELNKSNLLEINVNYSMDTLRLGALLLMTVCLKGFIGHLVNIVLLILLLIYVIEYVEELNKSQHSIHKVGALNAFETPMKNENCNHQCEICNQRNRNGRSGSQINYGYTNDDELPRSGTPIRNGNTRTEYMNPVYDRSNSWQPSPGSSRPFSYLEDVKRPPPPLSMPPPSPSASANDGQWRRDRWQTGMPPVPAPDYSPHGQRKLKSALKSYM